MLTEELVDSLCKFGLTTNQARVYSVIASNASIKIHDIASLTRIHEQDIYKILPKLEQIGLITRTTTKPFVVEALPPETALKELIKKHRENLDKAEKNTHEFIEALKDKRAVANIEKSEAKVKIFRNQSESYKNSVRITLCNMRKSYDMLQAGDNTNPFLRLEFSYIKEFEHYSFGKHKVKIRILSENENIEKNYFSGIEVEKYSTLDITIKKLVSNFPSPFFHSYSIIDGKEIWAGDREGKTPSEWKIMVTDCIPIVQIAKENFERAWHDRNAELIFSTSPSHVGNKKALINTTLAP